MKLILVRVDIVLQEDLNLVRHFWRDILAVEDAEKPQNAETQAAERNYLEAMRITPLKSKGCSANRLFCGSWHFGNCGSSQWKGCQQRLCVL